MSTTPNSASGQSTNSSASATGSNGGMHVLEFEKPIVKMEREIERLEATQAESGRDYTDVIRGIRKQLDTALKQAYGNLTAWETVLVARHPQRPLLRDYIRMITTDFTELHGDKLYGDDRALLTGFARIGSQRVMLVGHQKGRDTKEKIEANFGCAHPEGYRKALQKMQLAAKFKVPIVCLIDTPGAYPGVGAEERGIASAIAVNLMELSRLNTPIVAAVIGEGGSGGALGIAVADRVAVMQHSYYSVISPEGGAAILWKTGAEAPRAAEALRLTGGDLKKLKLIDDIITEPLGGAHRDPRVAADNLQDWIARSLRDVRKLKGDRLLKKRYERLRGLGSFFDSVGGKKAESVPTAKPSKSRSRAKAEPAAAV